MDLFKGIYSGIYSGEFILVGFFSWDFIDWDLFRGIYNGIDGI